MDLISNAFLAAFILGAVHAIEVDHMVAVSVFAGLKPKMRTAANYGARWGVGHALVVVLVGGLIALLNIKVPDNVVGYGETLVGVALIALGFWAMQRSKRFYNKDQSEYHEAGQNKNSHHHLPTAMGALHGLAGSAPVLALIPVTLLSSFNQVVIYLLLFSVGTTLAMTVYASLAAAAVQGLGLSKTHLQKLTTIIAFATIAVGLWWVASSLL